MNQDELARALPDIEVLIASVLPQLGWSSAKRLRLLQFLSSGVDHSLPLLGLPEGVIVANARGLHVAEMRDHALAMMLGFERSLSVFAKLQRDSRWQPTPAGTLVGKTVTILGLGQVGAAIASACASLGMRVLGSRSMPSPTPHVDIVFGLEALEEHLPNTDYLVITLPLTSKTAGVIGATALGRMKPAAVLIHLSRGGIVDEDALTRALQNGQIKGAALDAFETEPLAASSPLWSVPNLVITPHSAGLLDRHLERAMAFALDNIARVERGDPPLTPINLERGY